MKTWILFCFILPFKIFSQQLPEVSIRWLNESLKDKNVGIKEQLTDFIKYDFSNILLSEQDATIGFIGDNYQRFYIHFQEIVKNDTMPSLYLVKGKSRVGNNICDFEGEIKILHIREINEQQRNEMLKTAEEHNDIDVIERAKYKQFMILAEYVLNENQNQKWSGMFKGILKSCFYVKNNSIFYDNLEHAYSDSFSNNLFVGIWKMYNTSDEKRCCWGNYRIPYSGDLDIGAGEFSPNDKYLKYGWESYRKAYFEGNQDALKEEEKKWW